MFQKNNSCEITLTRLYDASVKTIWDAWNEPEQCAQWWGPRGFTLTSHKKELKVGGVWSYTMHGPDGTDFPNKTVYLEVEKYSRLVYDHGGGDDRPPMFRVTVTFTDVKGKTKMDMTMRLPTPEAAENARKFIKQAGGDATWDRFAEYLTKKSSGKEVFVINRSFDVPIEVMFDAWTNPKHISQWLSNGQGLTMYGKAKYLEIRKPDRLVYTQQFCDEKENISRHPLAPTWPETMLSTVTFHEEGPDKTRVAVTCEPHDKFTREELDAFMNERGGMTQGWTGSFDKLESFLETK